MEYFIVSGYVKSGTTFLQMLLDAHPTINCPSEHHFTTLENLLEKFADQYEAALLHLDGVTSNQGIRFDKRQFLTSMTRYAILELMHQGIGDEITHTGLNENMISNRLVEFYADLLPEVRFVFIVRDPRDVGVSLWHHNKRTSNSFNEKDIPIPETVVSTCGVWPDHINAISTFKDKSPERVHIVRYEDLIGKESDQHLTDLLEFLGAEVSDKILGPMWDATDFKKLQKKEKEKSGDKTGYFRSGKKESWREVLDEEQKNSALEGAGEAMKKFGYS